MDAEINMAKMLEEDTPIEIEIGGFGEAEVRIEFGPLRLLLSYEQLKRLDAQIHAYFVPDPEESEVMTELRSNQ